MLSRYVDALLTCISERVQSYSTLLFHRMVKREQFSPQKLHVFEGAPLFV